MSSDIIIEVDVFLKAIAFGAACGLLYDMLRIFRRVRTRGYVLTGIEDLLYWSVAAVIMFVFIYKQNGGTIRAYIIMGMVAGMFLYEMVLGRFIVKYLTLIFKKIFGFLDKIFGKFFKIVSLLLKKCFKPFKILIIRLKKRKVERKSRKINQKREKISGSSDIKRGAEVENRKNKKKRKEKRK